MRRRTTLALVVGGATAALAGGAMVRFRLGGHEPATPEASPEESQFTAYAPGGRWGFMFNGPVGRLSTRYMPIMQGGMYQLVADLLGLQPEDELLDIGCGPGAFLASKGRHVRRVAGIDASPVMIHDAERRLADRLAAGTARLVLGSAEKLPFGDGEFSAVSIISAPVEPAEAARVLRPGGRVVGVFEIVPDPRKPDHERTIVGPGWDEADTRRILEEAGLVVESVRYKNFSVLGSLLGAERIVSARKPAVATSSAAAEEVAAALETVAVG
jgi:SAM-dependent methyltransferase